MVATSEQKPAVAQREISNGSVSVIIPTYNERENIEANVDRCSRALEAAGCKYEIIVVDDDSPDRTWALIEEAYANNDHVRVFRRTENRGLALSIVEGFRTASMDYCVVIDGDLQHPPEKIPELLAALDNGADIAIASRHTDGGDISDWSWFRRAVSKGATAFAHASIPTARGITDPMSGFFAVRRSVVKRVDLNPQGYKILLEILSKCQIHTVEEVPYTFGERKGGESKLTAEQYQRFAEHTLELSIGEYATLIGEQPRRIVRLLEFFAVGGVGVLVNMIVFSVVVGGGHPLLAGMAAFLSAVQWNFVGNWLITFDRPRDALFQRYLSFHAVCGVGLVIYELALAALVFVPGVPVLLANLGAIAVSSIWNFIGSDTTAFADSFGDKEGEQSSTQVHATVSDTDGGK